MALVDISSLLHPGLTKLRIATPLTTFHPQEAARFAGFTTSFFCPEKTLPKAKAEGSPKPPKTGENKGSKGGKKGKSEKGKKKGGKSSKKSSGSSTSVKGQKKKKEGNVEDLNEKLKKNVPQEVPPEPKPEPSVVVYSNEGEKTFIVIELELIHPLVEKRKLEELHEDLIVVVGSKPIEPRMVRDLELIEDFSKEILQNLIRDVYERYHEYIVAKSKCGCGDKADFLTYLRRTGIFQSYTYSIINVTAMKIQSCPNLDNTKEGFVEEIFVYLVKKVREILHKQVGLKPPECRAVTSSEMLLSFAKEAKEIGDEAMAERYHLQRMAMDDSDPDPWFDYAVFMAELGEHPKAFACIQNVLGRDMYHKNGLLMNAIYLRDRGQRDAAETCFLTLVVQEPTWVEAWGVVYLFYEKDHDLGGMQLAKEMALKYLELNIEGSIINELTWTSAVLPNTMFFRAAAHLVKLRNFDWAEMALSHELYHAGYVHYLLAVISYYRQCYQHCLSHLQEAKHHCGYHHTITSLTGHCYLALGNSRKAHNEYLQILESFQRPTEMMHLFYLNCARALEALDSPNEARKLMLMACKSEPSPYIWSHCGLMYLQMNDLISAEECFSEATMLDNRLPDVWAQLSLINLKLDNLNEATLCYSLARKNGLNRSSKLGEEIEARLKKLGSEPC